MGAEKGTFQPPDVEAMDAARKAQQKCVAATKRSLETGGGSAELMAKKLKAALGASTVGVTIKAMKEKGGTEKVAVSDLGFAGGAYV